MPPEPSLAFSTYWPSCLALNASRRMEVMTCVPKTATSTATNGMGMGTPNLSAWSAASTPGTCQRSQRISP